MITPVLSFHSFSSVWRSFRSRRLVHGGITTCCVEAVIVSNLLNSGSMLLPSVLHGAQS